MKMIRLLAYALLLAAISPCQAADKLAQDLGEQVIQLPISLPQGGGDMTLTIYHPTAAGPHPLLVLSHGRAAKPEDRAKPERQRMEVAARYFLRKGFVVLVPTRIGYGASASGIDPESSGNCRRPDYRAALAPQVRQIEAALAYGRKLPDVDPQRVVLAGVSVGGIGTAAAAAENPPGVVAAINFSGGHGGNPKTHPGMPCDPEQLRAVYAEFGQRSRVPMLWLYARNDQFFGPRYSQAWAQAYHAAGGELEYKLLPDFGADGHKLFSEGADIWMPLAEDFLTRFGFKQQGYAPRPAPSGFAALEDRARIPYLKEADKQKGYGDFLASQLPRAFALSANGRWGRAYGPDAADRALDYCRRDNREKCALYAIDRDVVWKP
ncbi:S9 family peptidase [Chromobacterium sp. IIBBL 290-4]|uniref:alpha/beta hydrolase family protein n=1 Tax=Chromobacterium sp. IIBBL 290-4 TaxID=2953890 RepID=UPI0020B8BC0F|nr:dienelactone hydrolase family protein [Chromobacterium sp. IIBBL 290-4]UTH74925.1 dienelactone hydrolase family protein [Chromobacterium sp. IIBBL 290-4]